MNLASQLKDEHQEKWIAYSPEEVKIYAYADDLKVLLKKVKEIGKLGLVVQRILRFDVRLAS